MAVLRRVAEDTPRALQEILPQIPDWLVVIINKLLAKRPEDRFQSAKEVADLLAKCHVELQSKGAVTCVAGTYLALRDEPQSSHHAPRDEPSTAATSSKNCPQPGQTLSQSATVQPSAAPKGSSRRSETAPLKRPLLLAAGIIAIAAIVAIVMISRHYRNIMNSQLASADPQPGEFTMGSTPEEIEAALKDVDPNDKHWQECIKSEAPQHHVILTQAIYLGINEVTQAEYEKVMGVNPSHFAPMGAGKDAVTGMETNSHPVEMVSWNDAAEFCAKLSKQEELKPFYFRASETITPLDGTGYRLPTEAEWEYACRAGTNTKYWIGDKDEDLVRAGWFWTNSGGRTHAAGELKANPYGLCDIHGNVWEWVEDWWEPTYYEEFQEKPAIDPGVPSSAGSQRVLRGGDWGHLWSGRRAASRNAHDPPYRTTYLGFRVSLVAGVSRVSRP